MNKIKFVPIDHLQWKALTTLAFLQNKVSVDGLGYIGIVSDLGAHYELYGNSQHEVIITDTISPSIGRPLGVSFIQLKKIIRHAPLAYTDMDAGMFYCPYIPMMSVSVTVGISKIAFNHTVDLGKIIT